MEYTFDAVVESSTRYVGESTEAGVFEQRAWNLQVEGIGTRMGLTFDGLVVPAPPVGTRFTLTIKEQK